jgi:hypothetical protein
MGDISKWTSHLKEVDKVVPDEALRDIVVPFAVILERVLAQLGLQVHPAALFPRVHVTDAVGMRRNGLVSLGFLELPRPSCPSKT